VDPAKFPQLDQAGGHPAGGGPMRPRRAGPAQPELAALKLASYDRPPARRRAEQLARYLPSAVQGLQSRRAADVAQPELARPAARQEAGDDGGRGRVGEGGDGRLEQMHRLAAEDAEQQRANQAAIVDVEPLGRGDEHAAVTGHSMLGGSEEEVRVQPGKRARGQVMTARCGGKPPLPFRGDQVVAHVRGITEIQRLATGRGQAQRPVVREQDVRACGQAAHGEVGTGNDRRRRIDLDPQQ